MTRPRRRNRMPRRLTRRAWTGAGKRVRSAGRRTAGVWVAVHQRTSQVYCHYCTPMHYVRKDEWPEHRKIAAETARAWGEQERASKAAAKLAHDAAARAPRQPRPVNGTKNGRTPMQRNPHQPKNTAPDALLQAFHALGLTWPGDLKAEHLNAEQMAEVYTGAADVYRRMAESRAEQGMAAEIVEIYGQMGRMFSRFADLHMEIYTMALRRYGPLAEQLARPDVPKDYVASGVG